MSTSKSDFVSRKNKQDTFVSDDSGNFTASVFTDGDGSHVTLLSPRVDPAASVGGITEDGCYTSAVSLSDYLTAPSSPRNSAEPAESYLKAIFDNFNELYQDKMAWIDENIPDIDSHSHVMAKKNVLEHWVKDVIEQNNILVQTVEELETEAEKKVQVLQKKVYESAELAKEHMGMIKEYEDQIKQLMKEKHIVEKQEEFFRKESMYLEKEKRRALDRMHTLENDNSSLITLMNRIRDMGVWDTNGLNFTPRTYDCIFGLYPNLAGSEVQTVFTREKTRHLEKAENNIAQLMAQVEELHGRKNEAEKLLTEKTKVTEELQNDIKDLHIKIKQYQDEHQDFKRSLKETQEQLKAATLKNVQSRPSTGDTKRESEMKEMLGELRDLRNQLNIACTERQQAMKESNQLKTELKGRIVQMEDMKCLLDQIQTEAASTRNAVQDVQDKQGQMSSLKEEVSFYQTSYENSNVLLEAKSEIITRLQNQMDQLHDKMLAFDEWSRKQDVTHSDATGDRDSGHLSDFSDCWNWNGNEDEDKEVQMQQTAADMISTGCENYETICSSASEHSQSHIGPDLDRFQQLLIENQRLIEEKQELEELNKHLERDKSQTNDDHKKELELKDVEITMQKGLMVSNDQPLHLHQGHQKVNNPDSDAVVAVGGKIRHARQSCASLQDKVMDASRELTCIKNLTEKLHVKSKMLEKHDLLHKSYVLLGQIERDHNYYLEGIDGSLDRDEGEDYLDSITTTTVRIPVPVPAGSTQDADAEPQGAHSHSEQPFNDESSANIDFNWKNSYHMELRQISEFAVAVNAQVTDKFTLVEYLKQETEEMQRVVQLLSKSVEDLVVKGNTENVKLIEKIEKLERKQAQTDEVLRMESEIHGMHTEIQEYDAGVLLTEKRLGVIQNSYDKLSHELIRRDELISQRDAKIAELESYIKESDILNQSNSMHSTSNSFSEHFEFEHSVVVPNENSNSSFLHQSSDVEKIGKLIWLVSALKKKLKKKKDREDSVRKEKEILMNLVSNMSSTWNGLRAGCDQVRLENELLKTKLETQSQNVIMHSPKKMLPSVVHPHSLQSSSSRHWSHQEEGDGDKSGYELTTQSQVQAMQITPRSQIENNNSNNSSGSGIGRIVYPLRSHTDCSLKFPQSSSPHSKGLSDSDILHQQQHPTTSAKAPGNRGILTVTPRNTNTNTNNSANLHFPFQISSMGSLNTNQFKDDELYGISSIPPTATAPQSHNLSPSSPIFLTESDKDKSLDISFISPPKCIGLESSHESRVQMCPIPIPNFTFPPTYSPSLHQSQRQPQQPVYHEPRTQDRHDVNEAEPSSELQDLVRLWEECHARTRQVLNLGHLSVPSHTSDSSFQRSEHE